MRSDAVKADGYDEEEDRSSFEVRLPRRWRVDDGNGPSADDEQAYHLACDDCAGGVRRARRVKPHEDTLSWVLCQRSLIVAVECFGFVCERLSCLVVWRMVNVDRGVSSSRLCV